MSREDIHNPRKHNPDRNLNLNTSAMETEVGVASGTLSGDQIQSVINFNSNSNISNAKE